MLYNWTRGLQLTPLASTLLLTAAYVLQIRSPLKDSWRSTSVCHTRWLSSRAVMAEGQ